MSIVLHIAVTAAASESYRTSIATDVACPQIAEGREAWQGLPMTRNHRGEVCESFGRSLSVSSLVPGPFAFLPCRSLRGLDPKADHP